MALNALEAVNYYRQADTLRNTATVRQLHQTNIFLAENGPILETATVNALAALDRFALPPQYRAETADKIVFLWTQAKLAQKAADLHGDNPISGFNVGVALGVHLENPDTHETEFFFTTGANREPDKVPIALPHAETSAIESGRQQLMYIVEENEKPPGIDIITLTASPCGACRAEIYKSRSSDKTLVAVIDDKGNVTINTITELFPTKFPTIGIRKVPTNLLQQAYWAARQSIPSKYQKDKALPLWGVALGTEKGVVVSGHGLGDDAFWSNTPTLSAVDSRFAWAQNQDPFPYLKASEKKYSKLKLNNYRERVERIAFSGENRITQVVYYYIGNPPSYFPSGIERQQLSRLDEDTKIFFVFGKTKKAYVTTRGELLPSAFTAPSQS